MRNITVDGKKYNMHFFVADDGAWLANADFGHIKTGKTTLFSMVVRDLENGTEETLTGDAGWGKVSTEEDADYLFLTYGNPENGADLSVTVTVALHESGAAFDVRVCNADARFSVLSAAYPIPSPTDETFDFFMAKGPGRLIRDFRHHPYNLSTTYPSIEYAMQYMAFFTEKGGLYVGHHDRTGAVKHYRMRSENGETDFAVIYPAENFGRARIPFYCAAAPFGSGLTAIGMTPPCFTGNLPARRTGSRSSTVTVAPIRRNAFPMWRSGSWIS